MPSGVEPIILCGGAGLRLRTVTGGSPKSLAHIGNRPFLEILISQLQRHGFDNVVLAVGYQSEAMKHYFGDQSSGFKISYSVEKTPLGTGGALRDALAQINSKAALVMNGDSYTNADLLSFVKDYQTSNAELSVVVVPADGREDCGSVSVTPSGMVVGFKEKQSLDGRKYVNAGIYLIDKRMRAQIPSGAKVSLEAELFPRWIAEGKTFRAFHHPGPCIDIGTPERYESAQNTLTHVELDEISKSKRNRTKGL
jgi:D-glycero-alpha-D-manno-heptose 1-phosphate guanylyltransferase